MVKPQGETMNFSLDKQMERVVEVLALSALMASNPNKKVEKKLRQFAFPLSIDLQNANKGDIEKACPKCGHERCSDGSLTALRKTIHGIWCNRCVEYIDDLL